MNANGTQSIEREEEFGQALAEWLRAAEQGQPPDEEEYLGRYPQFAVELGEYIADWKRFPRPNGVAATGVITEPMVPGDGVLGDFRIVREVGRGGMGVVYEAQQISLSRRVALKVLPLAGTLDSRHLQRFKNEAQAAAYLQHQNIVPVYFVGCDRGVHYYAMQFIDGHSLAEVIDQLRQERANLASDPQASTGYFPNRSSPAEGAEGGPVAAGTQVTRAERAGRAETVPGSATPATGLSPAAYFAWVARLGEQAALALEHAHQLGVLHRDIKPANLMLDARGNVWVTDFGLAHLPGDQRLTMTSDLLGTLRYMSPEQALAQRVVIDQRTDVYSLGVTLYELLTLQPAYRGTDRQELLRQIAFEEPKAPRRLDKAIPLELETIVLKAMAKAPDERYASAQELADDLRHWLEDRPIRARRPPLRIRLRRWARRHRPLVAAGAAAALVGLLVSGVSIGVAARDRAAKRAAITALIEAALDESVRWQRQGKQPKALSSAQRACGLLAGADVNPSLAGEATGRVADLALLQALQQVRVEGGTAIKNGHLDGEAKGRLYSEAFKAAGLDVEALPVEEAAARIRGTSVPVELAAVLDDWADTRRATRGMKDPGWRALLRVASLADPESERAQVRQALAAWNRPALRRLAAAADVSRLSPTTLAVLGSALMSADPHHPTTEMFLRAAQRQHPGDFWLNHLLFAFFSGGPPQKLATRVEFARAAVAVLPESPAARNNLGSALAMSGRDDEAIAEFRAAVHLGKDFPEVHCNLGTALSKKGRLDEAIAEFRYAIRLQKDCALAHYCLADAFREKGRFDDAIAEYREAIRLNPDDAVAHNDMAVALERTARVDEAIAEYRAAIRLKKDFARAHYDLAIALSHKGQLAEAISEYRTAIRLKEDHAEAHCNLARLLMQQGHFREAATEYRRGHELGSRRPGWSYPSAMWLHRAEATVGLNDRLADFLAGRAKPKDAEERLNLAQLCQQPCKRLEAASARWFAEAFAAQPKFAADMISQHRYSAACAAALAGCNKGKDASQLSSADRARLRRQALSWLRAQLGLYRQILDRHGAGAPRQIAGWLHSWSADEDLAGVRNSEALVRLPAPERRAWQQLWMDVGALRRRAAAGH